MHVYSTVVICALLAVSSIFGQAIAERALHRPQHVRVDAAKRMDYHAVKRNLRPVPKDAWLVDLPAIARGPADEKFADVLAVREGFYPMLPAEMTRELYDEHEVAFVTNEKLIRSSAFDSWYQNLAHYVGFQRAFKLVYSRMVPRFGSEESLNNFLVTEMVNDDQRLQATGLLYSQIKHWVDEEKTPDEIFELMKLHLATESPFGSENFSLWLTFVKTKYKKDHESIRMMFRTLSRYYDDNLLTSALVENLGGDFYEQLLFLRIMKGKLAGEPEEVVRQFVDSDKVKRVNQFFVLAGEKFERSDSKIFIACKDEFGDAYLSELLSDISAADSQNILVGVLRKLQFRQWFETKNWPKSVEGSLLNIGVSKEKVEMILADYQQYILGRRHKS